VFHRAANTCTRDWHISAIGGQVTLYIYGVIWYTFTSIFDWIGAKGKSKKLALLAVYNKLLKQAFVIVKSGVN
jgi:hypothetical protein